MLYNPPTGAANANDPYVGKNLAAGTQGSKVPPGAIEYTQREIVNAIAASGQNPTNNDLAQLLRAIRSGKLHYAADTGTVNALAIAFGTTHTANTAGLRFAIKVKVTNTGPSTLAVDGISPAPIRRLDGSALNAGDLVANQVVTVLWNDALNAFQLATISAADLRKLVDLPVPVTGPGFNIAPTYASNATLAANQSIPNNIETAVSWPNPYGALPGEWSAGAPSRFVISAGIRKIRVQYEACFDNNGTGARKARILMDGLFEGSGLPAERKPAATGADVTILQGAGGIFDVTLGGTLNADGSHYIQLMVFQDSGGPLALRAANTWCSIDFLG